MINAGGKTKQSLNALNKLITRWIPNWQRLIVFITIFAKNTIYFNSVIL